MTKILVAEDDPHQQRLWSFLLRQWGYEVTLAHNAADAEAFALADPPALVVLDMQMPLTAAGSVAEFGGLAALRAMRQHPALARVPALAITAQPEYYLIEPGLPDEVFEVVIKPFDLPSLQKTVAAALASGAS